MLQGVSTELIGSGAESQVVSFDFSDPGTALQGFASFVDFSMHRQNDISGGVGWNGNVGVEGIAFGFP